MGSFYSKSKYVDSNNIIKVYAILRSQLLRRTSPLEFAPIF